MHVWYVDKQNGAEFEELPAIRFVWFCQFRCKKSRICHLFEHYPPRPTVVTTAAILGHLAKTGKATGGSDCYEVTIAVQW